jgi:hypothetical protein
MRCRLRRYHLAHTRRHVAAAVEHLSHLLPGQPREDNAAAPVSMPVQSKHASAVEHMHANAARARAPRHPDWLCLNALGQAPI